MVNAKDVGKYFVIRPDNRNLNYDAYMEKGHKNIQDIKEYNSENTKRLSLKEMTSLLEKIWPIQVK